MMEVWYNFVSMVTNWIMGYDGRSLKGLDIFFKTSEWVRCYDAMNKILGVLAILLAVCLLWCVVDTVMTKLKEKKLVSKGIES